jgi:hypothetical protein
VIEIGDAVIHALDTGAAGKSDRGTHTMPKILSAHDWMALPEISVPTLRNENEVGSVYKVAKVGFFAGSMGDCEKLGLKIDAIEGKCVLPTITIDAGNQQSLCRLPVELTMWVIDCAALAKAGRNQFPADVEFGCLHGRTYAEFVV